MRQRALVVLLVLFSTASWAAEPPEYQAMRAARPDGRRVAVSGLTLVRDAYTFEFKNGTFHFLAPVGERTWGAVFIGDGQWTLDPAIVAERRHLQLVTRRDDLQTLSDSFDSLILLFSDRSADEIAAAATQQTGAPDARAVELYEHHLNEQKRKYQVNLHLRVLQEVLNEPAARGDVFIAAVDGKDLAPALLIVDRHGIGSLAARFADLGGEETALLSYDDHNGGFWYLAPARDRKDAGRSTPARRSVDATHYTIDTTIASNLQLTGTTTIRLQATSPGVRVVPIHLLPKIRLQRVTYRVGDAPPVDVGFVQEEVQLGKLARLFRDEVADADAAVILPAAMQPGKPLELMLEYEGRDVLHAWTGDSYSVRARESWYPNLGTFADTATYELQYRYPKRNDLISTGVRVSESEEGGERVAVWRSTVPMRIAGFNYGRFVKLSQTDDQSGVQVDVYTDRARRKFASDAMADALNAARVAKVFFGAAPYSPFSVTQQMESFGQSWPSLIYLPALALTSSTERVMALAEENPRLIHDVNEFAKTVGWHEVAHQWWGHTVGWQSYRDVWLSEGLSEFTSALVLQFVEGPKAYDALWGRLRRQILQKERGGTVSNNDAGPISQGFRLHTRHSPGASHTIIYSKGAFVIHMLRSLMRDTKSRNPDERFMAMMKDFATTYAWKSPSTDDFKRIVERHMTPHMNAAENGRMDWFFDQWVHGTEVPRLKSTLKVQPAGNGKFTLSGAVSQDGVSAGFISVVPIYADFGKDLVVPMGSIRLIGSASQEITAEIPLPRAPRRIIVNAFHDVLARE